MDKLLGNHVAAKILALILASIMWLYVMNEQNPPLEAGFSVPIVQKNLAAGLVAFNVPDIARVRIKGPRSTIANVTANDIRCTIDFANAGEGNHTLRLQVAIPASLELLEIYPDKATVELDAIITREFPVNIQFTGVVSPDVIVEKAVLTPNQTVLTGPKRYVDNVTRVVGFVDITDKIQDIEQQVRYRALNREGKQIEQVVLKPDRGAAKVNILQKPDKAIVDVKAVVFGDLPEGLAIRNVRTEPNKVEITGPPEEVKKITHLFTEPINIAGFDKDVTTEVNLQTRPGIITNVSKVKVTVAVKKSNL